MLMCVWCLLLGSLYFAVLFIYTICIHMCVRGVMFFFFGVVCCVFHVSCWFFDVCIFFLVLLFMILVFSCLFFHAACLVTDMFAWFLMLLLSFLMGLMFLFFFECCLFFFSFGWMFGIFSMFLLFFYIRCLMVFDLFAGFCFLIGFDVSCCFLVVARSWLFEVRVKQVDHEGINGFELPEPYHGRRSLQPLLNSLRWRWRGIERERDAFCVPAWEFPNLMQLEAAAMAVSRAPCIVMEVRCNCMSTRATVWQRNRFPKRTFSASFISFLLIWSLMNVIRINNVFPCEIMKCRMLMHKLLRKSKRTD